MVCPRCGAALKKKQYRDRIGFGCPEGHGIAMTTSAVRGVCGSREFVNLLWIESGKAECGEGAACPVCRRPMRKVTLDAAGRELELDVCRRCQEVWFDPHEIEALPPIPKKEVLPPEVREALALERVRNVGNAARPPGGHLLNSGDFADPLQFLVTLFGLPVEEDAPPLQRLPFVTWGLILICVAVFLLTAGDLETCVNAWGFIPAEAGRKYGATWITSMFMHGGILHLVGNMYFLWVFGDNVEDELGKVRYMVFTLLSGISATLLYLAFRPASAIPCIGASGFISGIIAMYAVLYPKVNILMRGGLCFSRLNR